MNPLEGVPLAGLDTGRTRAAVATARADALHAEAARFAAALLPAAIADRGNFALHRDELCARVWEWAYRMADAGELAREKRHGWTRADSPPPPAPGGYYGPG